MEKRIEDVHRFLKEIDSTLQYEVVPIDDPFGPTKSDPNMDMIVVSAETLRGGEKVNELRVQNKLNPLEIFCIELVEATDKSGPKESKVSSSNTRIDMLGRRLRSPEVLKSHCISLTNLLTLLNYYSQNLICLRSHTSLVLLVA